MDSGNKPDNGRELTSTMGNVLSGSIKDEKNDTSDATPTSSTDANNTTTSSQIVSDDPISSTSSDVGDQNKAKTVEVALQSSLEGCHIAMEEADKTSTEDPETDLLEMSISSVSRERITEDVEDLVHDLESLLGESTESFNIPVKRKEPTGVKADLEKANKSDDILPLEEAVLSKSVDIVKQRIVKQNTSKDITNPSIVVVKQTSSVNETVLDQGLYNDDVKILKTEDVSSIDNKETLVTSVEQKANFESKNKEESSVTVVSDSKNVVNIPQADDEKPTQVISVEEQCVLERNEDVTRVEQDVDKNVKINLELNMSFKENQETVEKLKSDEHIEGSKEVSDWVVDDQLTVTCEVSNEVNNKLDKTEKARCVDESESVFGVTKTESIEKIEEGNNEIEAVIIEEIAASKDVDNGNLDKEEANIGTTEESTPIEPQMSRVCQDDSTGGDNLTHDSLGRQEKGQSESIVIEQVELEFDISEEVGEISEYTVSEVEVSQPLIQENTESEVETLKENIQTPIEESITIEEVETESQLNIPQSSTIENVQESSLVDTQEEIELEISEIDEMMDTTEPTITENIEVIAEPVVEFPETENVEGVTEQCEKSNATENVKTIGDKSMEIEIVEFVTEPCEESDEAENIKVITEKSKESVDTENVEVIIESSNDSIETEKVEVVTEQSENAEAIDEPSKDSTEAKNVKMVAEQYEDSNETQNVEAISEQYKDCTETKTLEANGEQSEKFKETEIVEAVTDPSKECTETKNIETVGKQSEESKETENVKVVTDLSKKCTETRNIETVGEQSEESKKMENLKVVTDPSEKCTETKNIETVGEQSEESKKTENLKVVADPSKKCTETKNIETVGEQSEESKERENVEAVTDSSKECTETKNVEAIGERSEESKETEIVKAAAEESKETENVATIAKPTKESMEAENVEVVLEPLPKSLEIENVEMIFEQYNKEQTVEIKELPEEESPNKSEANIKNIPVQEGFSEVVESVCEEHVEDVSISEEAPVICLNVTTEAVENEIEALMENIEENVKSVTIPEEILQTAADEPPDSEEVVSTPLEYQEKMLLQLSEQTNESREVKQVEKSDVVIKLDIEEISTVVTSSVSVKQDISVVDEVQNDSSTVEDLSAVSIEMSKTVVSELISESTGQLVMEDENLRQEPHLGEQRNTTVIQSDIVEAEQLERAQKTIELSEVVIKTDETTINEVETALPERIEEILDEDSKSIVVENECMPFFSAAADSDSEDTVPTLVLEPDEVNASPEPLNIENDISEIVEPSITVDSTNDIEIPDKLQEIEEILNKQGNLNDVMEDIVIEKSLVVSSLVEDSLQDSVTTDAIVEVVEPQMSEKERKEMEALRKAVESITEAPSVSYEVEEITSIEKNITPESQNLIEVQESNIQQSTVHVETTKVVTKPPDEATQVPAKANTQATNDVDIKDIEIITTDDNLETIPETSNNADDVDASETVNTLPDSSHSVMVVEELKLMQTAKEKELKIKSTERSKRHKKSTPDNKLEELSINVDVPEREKPYSPKVTIKPIKVPDEEVSTTSNSDSEIAKGSLKMTITKQSDKMHSILKICETENSESFQEQDEPIPKLIIKPKMQQVEQQHSPKMSTRSSKQMYSPTSSTQRSGSPRITIKPVIKPDKPEAISPLKIKIKPEEPSKKHSPKLNIKPVTKPDEECRGSLQSPRKVIIKPVVNPPDEIEQVPSPRITIKPIPKPEIEKEMINTPKLNIKPIKKQEEDETDVDRERSSPKITIKPVIKPQEHDIQISEPDDEVKERIVLKINKGNLPTPTKEPKKREHAPDDEKSEKLAKITVKFSKGGGHPHIVQQTEQESNKRSHEDISTPEKVKKQKMDNESLVSTRSKHKDDVHAIETRSKHSHPGESHIEVKRIKLKDNPESSIYESGRPKQHNEISEFARLETKIDSPIVISEDSRSQDSGSCVVIEDTKDLLGGIQPFGLAAKPILENSPTVPHVQETVSPIIPTAPTPRKRGRPRKVPIVVREEFKEQEEQPKLELPKTTDSQPQVHESGRPKRSCRGQSVRATLGIKPRKPRGPGRGRGSKRGMGSRVIAMKPEELSK